MLVPPAPVLQAARRAIGPFDLAPATCETANRSVGARSCLGPERGLSEPWMPLGGPDDWDGTVWVHPPPGREEQFAERLARMLGGDWDGVAVWLSDALTSAPWAQLLFPYVWVCSFPAGDMVFDNVGPAGGTRRRGPQMLLVTGVMQADARTRAVEALSPLGSVLEVAPEPEDPDDETDGGPDAD